MNNMKKLIFFGIMIGFFMVGFAAQAEAPACQVRPACLDARPACMIPEPEEGYCAFGCYYEVVQCFTTPCDPIFICPLPIPAVILPEGTMVSAFGTIDPDIYIVNSWGYKRLFLNPIIFNFYGHLGGWGNVTRVSPVLRDQYFTSVLFQNCETNDPKVYALEVTGEDTGTLHHVQVAGDVAVRWDANFFKKVFCINNNEFVWYAKADPYTFVGQIPVYRRQ